MLPRKNEGRKGSLPWWQTAILCLISFFMGRNTSGSIVVPTSLSPSETQYGCQKVALQQIGALKAKIMELEEGKSGVIKNNTHELEIEKSGVPKNNTTQTAVDCQSEIDTLNAKIYKYNTKEFIKETCANCLVFDEAWVADPNQVMKTINFMCKQIMDHNSKESRKIGVGTIMFCYTHVLTYIRNYNYEWDSIEGVQSYHTGVQLPPYQMDMFQYIAVLSTAASIPSKHIKDELEAKGKGFQDFAKNYDGRITVKNPGPRVLFWGCGSDTPLHAHVIEYLRGNITFIDNNDKFVKICKQYHNDIRLVEPTGNRTWHTKLIEKTVPQDGSGLETDEIEDPLTASQWMSDLDGIEKEDPWDVIVVDGPAEFLGRSMPLYMAKRLAQSYSPNHYTHIFLHDASRADNCIIANAIMGHDPSTYLGNTLPRKGLKHWRIPGRNRKLPPTRTSKVTNETSKATIEMSKATIEMSKATNETSN